MNLNVPNLKISIAQAGRVICRNHAAIVAILFNQQIRASSFFQIESKKSSHKSYKKPI